MHKGKYVFSQLLDFLDRNDFNYLSRKYGGDKYVKQFTCYNQLCVLMFGQLSNRESLRDVVLATQAHASKAYHLGFGKHAAKSTLADANTKRDYRIFEEFAYKVIAEAQRCRIVDIFKLNGNVYAFDSTTVDLCLSTFEWALFRKKKGGIKMHTLYDLETQIPTFFHITPARVHDTKAMDVIPYEENSFYIFDRGYNDFKPMKWKHLINRYYQPLRFRFTYIYQGMTHQAGMVLPQRTLYQSHLSLLSDYLQGLRFFGRNLLRDTET